MKLTPSQMDYLQIGKKEKKIIKSDIKQSRFYYVQMKRNIKKQRKSFKQTNTTFLTTLPTCTITKFGHKATLLYVGTKYFFYVFFIGMYTHSQYLGHLLPYIPGFAMKASGGWWYVLVN